MPLSLAVLAVVEFVLGAQLRSRIGRRPGTAPVLPLIAARAVALAKATSLVGRRRPASGPACSCTSYPTSASWPSRARMHEPV
ncbi:MAG: DUF3180 family protein [Geodermatophilaceae bacterium]